MPRRMSGCDSRQPHQFSQAVRQLARQSLQNSVCSGQHRGGLPTRKSEIKSRKFYRGRGRQVMHLPCKQAHMGAVPIGSTISLRGTRLKHREKPHKLLQVGVIPTPATNLGGVPAAGL